MIVLISILAYEFFYTGKKQTQELDIGTYVFECWGAQGSGGYSEHVNQISSGGKGAHTKAIINVTKKTTFSIYIGGAGKKTDLDIYDINYKPISYGGYNGGGDSGNDLAASNGFISGAGGGATDIRIGTTRIMVAAGGSGGAGYADGAPGGNENGYHLTANKKSTISYKTTQTKGGANGQGEKGKDNWKIAGSGGGGGYYGGVAATFPEDDKITDNEHFTLVADSGSSYISTSCFKNISYEIGVRSGNGKARITPNCLTDCYACSNDYKCTKCTNYAYLYENVCVKKCPYGTYGKDKTGPQDPLATGSECIPCNETCSTCISDKTCTSCEYPYFFANLRCHLNCSDADFKDKHFGINRNATSKCQECQVTNCTSCWSDSTKCDQCIDSYIFDNDKKQCVPKPTDIFTQSRYFSESSDFTKSTSFSESSDFTKSKSFSEPMFFSKNDQFSVLVR